MFYLIEAHDVDCRPLAEADWRDAHHFTLYQSGTFEGISGPAPDFVCARGTVDLVGNVFLDLIGSSSPKPKLFAIQPVLDIVIEMALSRKKERVLH